MRSLSTFASAAGGSCGIGALLQQTVRHHHKHSVLTEQGLNAVYDIC